VTFLFNSFFILYYNLKRNILIMMNLRCSLVVVCFFYFAFFCSRTWGFQANMLECNGKYNKLPQL
jgi:hypothetical protein